MPSLVLAACFFVGIHLFVSGTALRGDDTATGSLRITRHPFLVGVALWAAA
jgi:uncharacterized membrane protein